jgi:hypothetical protein
MQVFERARNAWFVKVIVRDLLERARARSAYSLV